MKPTLLLDVDGVLADFVSAALNIVHDVTGVRHHPNEITTGELFDSIGDASLREITYTRMNEPGFSENHIRPFPGAVEGVRSLLDHAEIFIVTAPFREAAWIHGRYAWLERHFNIPRTHVLFTGQKHLVRGDVFVDDNVGHVQKWTESKHGGTGLLWDRPYNRDSSLSRIHTWEDVRAALLA